MPASKKSPKPAPVFVKVRAFLKRFSHLQHENDYDVIAAWAIGTWAFSPAAPFKPQSYPYLYITGQKGSGKTHLGRDVMQHLTRNHKSVTGVTGPALFRMIGTFDEESGQVLAHYPTMFTDEMDATFSGNKDENLRLVYNEGYKPGGSIPRVSGKVTIEYPAYCPKILGGITNGQLPNTITDRCIRIDLRKATADQMDALEEGPYSWLIEDESAALADELQAWAIDNAMVFRDYTPTRPDKIGSGRPWEISRPLIQLAQALGIEARLTDALAEVMSRKPERSSGREAVAHSLVGLLKDNPGVRNLTTREILARMEQDGVALPGDGGGKGLGVMLPGVKSTVIRLKGEGKPEADWDPRVSRDPRTGEPRFIARGYRRIDLEEVAAEILADDGTD